MAAAGVVPAAAVAAAEPEVVSLLSDDEEQPQQHSTRRASNGRGAGPSRPVAAATPGPERRSVQQQRPRGGSSADADVIDLTLSSSPDEVQVVASTVQRVPMRVPMRGTKRPRVSPQQQLAQLAAQAQVAALSPQKRLLLHQLRAAAAAPHPPPDPEPEGPKCGICMEPMGGAQGRQMGSGNCGHTYCFECLVEAVKAQKKCPTCRKSMQVRQIHKVFINFS